MFASVVYEALRVNHCASVVFDEMYNIDHHTGIHFLSHKGLTLKEI